MTTFNPDIYAPEERAEARERYYAFDDERAESEREFRHEREQDRLSEIPNPNPEIAAMHPDERFQLMFDVPASAPKWRELMERHGITASLKHRPFDPEDDPDHNPEFVAVLNTGSNYEHEYGETERDAVVALIHRLKLEGWETVSAR